MICEIAKMSVQSRTSIDANAVEDRVDGDTAKRMLRSVLSEAPSKLLVSVLAEDLTDTQLEELIAKPRFQAAYRKLFETGRGSQGSASECIKQERVDASGDEEVLEVGPLPEDGNIASDDDNDDEEEIRPTRRKKRRNSRIGDSDESEREAEPDQGEGSEDSDQEPLNRTTQSLPALTQSVRKLRRRSSRLQEPEVSMSEESDESDLSSRSSNREPLRRTRSATHSLPSDSPSARTIALRKLRQAKAKRQLTYGEDDRGRGGKAARFESSSDSGTGDEAESSDDADEDLPELPSEDELSWDYGDEDGDTDVDMDDNDMSDESEYSSDSADASSDDDSGSNSDDFATLE